jgi:hypothetical protein
MKRVTDLLAIFLFFGLGFCASFVFLIINIIMIAIIFPIPEAGIDMTKSWLAYPFVGLITLEIWLLFSILKIRNSLLANPTLYRFLLALFSAVSFWHWYSNLSWWMWD